MRTKLLLWALILPWLFFLPACGFLAPIIGPVYQTTSSNVDQEKDQGYLRFTNITSQHQIYLDGASIGSGEPYSSGDLLGVSPGTHLVEIMRDGNVELQQKVFIGTGSTRTIELK